VKNRFFSLFFLALLAAGCGPEKPREAIPPLVTETRAFCQTVPLFQDYIAHTSANSTVKIYSQAAGKIISKHYTGGALVKEGDLLFNIDSRPYLADLQKAESLLEETSAKLKMAKEKAESYTQLIKDDIVSQLDYDQSLTDVLTLEAQAEQTRSDIVLSKLKVSWCSVRAPVTGFPGISNISTGTYVPVGGPDALVTLQQAVPMSLDFYIPEKEWSKIRSLMDEGAVRVQALSLKNGERIYEGTLAYINNQIDRKTGTIWLEATFPNEDLSMWPTEYFVARLFYGVAEHALLIPEEALVKTQRGDQIFVIKEDNTVELRTVTAKKRYREFALIDCGLQEGERVVLRGQINLSDGTKVAIKEEESLPLENKGEGCPE